ncbi:MAG: hypothetical protein K2X49_17305 [Acetobacteraceae bacterium]|nr:hypothetical protein [Acetobacteraceae bacterium]
MDVRLLHLIATVIDACDRPPGPGPGHPPTETIRVVATLRRFLRGGTPWRGLTATGEQASGSTLRRCLARWTRTGLLAKVHVRLASMLRGHPDLVLNAWVLENRRLVLRYDRLGLVIQSLLQAACIFLVAGRLVREFWKPPLERDALRQNRRKR